MYKNGNKKPETTTPVLFGKSTRTIKKPENKNLYRDELKSRAAKSCKQTCNKSTGGKTSPNTETLIIVCHNEFDGNSVKFEYFALLFFYTFVF